MSQQPEVQAVTDRVRLALEADDPALAASLVQNALDQLDKEWERLGQVQAALESRESRLRQSEATPIEAEREQLRRQRRVLEEDRDACTRREQSVGQRQAELALGESALTQRQLGLEQRERVCQDRQDALARLAESLHRQQEALAQSAGERQEVERLRESYLRLRDHEDKRQAEERARLHDLRTSLEVDRTNYVIAGDQLAKDQLVWKDRYASESQQLAQQSAQAQITKAQLDQLHADVQSRLEECTKREHQLAVRESSCTQREQKIEQQLASIHTANEHLEVRELRCQKEERRIKLLAETTQLKAELSKP